MSGYTLILHECDGSSSAVDGFRSTLGDIEQARAAAIRLARTVMAREVSQGRLCLSCWVVVKNEQGHAIMTLPFGDAIALVDHPACGDTPDAIQHAGQAQAPSGISTGPTISR